MWDSSAGMLAVMLHDDRCCPSVIVTGSSADLWHVANDAVAAGDDMELTCHDGTVRDLVFMPDTAHKSSLLVSAGAGDCKICVTDCASGALLRAMPGHSGEWWRTSSLSFLS